MFSVSRVRFCAEREYDRIEPISKGRRFTKREDAEDYCVNLKRKYRSNFYAVYYDGAVIFFPDFTII